MTDLVLIARRRTQVDSRTHYPGCEREHTECLIQRMADEIERRDEWREWATAEIEKFSADNQAAVQAYAAEINEAKAEIERLREDNETLNEIIAIHGNEINRLRAERDDVRAELSNLQIAFNDWKVFHSTVRLEVEIERLKEKLIEGAVDDQLEIAWLRDEINRLRAEREQAWNAALESAIDACIAIHATTATTHAANSVRSCVDAIRALKDVK